MIEIMGIKVNENDTVIFRTFSTPLELTAHSCQFEHSALKQTYRELSHQIFSINPIKK